MKEVRRAARVLIKAAQWQSGALFLRVSGWTWTSCVSVRAEKSGGGVTEGRVEVFRNWATLIGGGTLGGARDALCQRGASVFTWSGREFRVFKCPPRRARFLLNPGNDPFVRAELNATLSENVHSPNDNDALHPEYIAPIARER